MFEKENKCVEKVTTSVEKVTTSGWKRYYLCLKSN